MPFVLRAHQPNRSSYLAAPTVRKTQEARCKLGLVEGASRYALGLALLLACAHDAPLDVAAFTTLEDATTQGVLSRAQAKGFDTSKLEWTPQPGGPAAPQGNVLPPESHGCSAGPVHAGGAWLAPAIILLPIAHRRRRSGMLRPSCAQ
jgi:MYXO-CTERM domain-containing protein